MFEYICEHLNFIFGYVIGMILVIVVFGIFYWKFR